MKESQQGLIRLREYDHNITSQARINFRLNFARVKSQMLHRQLSGMIPPSLSSSISALLTSFTQPPSNTSTVTLTSTNPTLLDSIQCTGTASAASQLVKLKNSAEKISQGADRLEKHLKMAGFKNRKKFTVEISKEGTHPWFPVMVFEREK